MVANDSGAMLAHGDRGATAHLEPKMKLPYRQEPIAVVGMACRLPGQSNTPKALWDFLMRGGIADTHVPESRFRQFTHYDASTKPKTMRSPGGMFLENIDVRNFDAAFFSISHTDAVTMDPQQRQLLEVVFECLENSGITLEQLDKAAVACLVGTYSVDYDYMHARDPEDRPPGVTIGIGRAILSNRISHFLNIKGPSMSIDTACSGSLVSLDVACRYLNTGEVDGAIVAGANIYLSPEHVMDSGTMKGAASVSGKCHTFDAKADGYIKAEAVNAVYLKRLSDAIRDGDPIRSVIRGTATNSDGRTPGIASPSASAQALAIRAAYANAGITNFNDTSYLEFHGTGTQAGDPTEVQGVASVFAPGRDPDKPLYIGSIKSNIGHSEPAAGISGLLKAVLSIENSMIPGNPTFIDPSPKIDFVGSKVSASRVARPWPAAARCKRASVNSFGYGGSNVHVVIEETGSFVQDTRHKSSYMTDSDDLLGLEEQEDASSAASRRPYLLCLSANDDDALQANFARLRTHLMNPQVKAGLPDLAYTLNERRSKLYSRGYIITSSTDLDAGAFSRGKKNTHAPKIGFVFTGQGAQWSQMGHALVETFPGAKKILGLLDEALQSLPTPPEWRLLDELTQVRSPEYLRRPEFSQPLVTALQIVLVDILQQWGISPESVVGHSSGEIAAAYTAGLITREQAIVAAFYRGYASHLSAPAQDLGMLAAGISAAEFPTYSEGLEDQVSIACFNSPQSITISGPVTALEQVRARLAQDAKFGRLLQVNMAYHSKFMDHVGAEYLGLLAPRFQSHKRIDKGVRMFSSVTGQLLDSDSGTDTEYWRGNMVNPVLFDQAVQSLLASDNHVNFLIEIGPSGALAGPIKQILAAMGDDVADVQYCVALSRGRDAVLSTFDVAGKLFVAGGSVDLRAVNQLASSGQEGRPSLIVDLPNYAWNYSTQYWFENDASKDWRYRLFPHHDLIGTKIPGTSWNEPSFRKKLSLNSLPWLKDHKMGTDIIFPAAGFVAMAVEGVRQKTQAMAMLEERPSANSLTYRLRNMTFSRALVLEENTEHKVMLTLTPKTGSGILGIQASPDILAPLRFPTDAALWYKAMNDQGYGFGPAFQNQIQVEATSGKRSSRSTVSLEEPASEYRQSFYPLHPAVMDGCFQTSGPSLWAGNRSDLDAVLIPALIGKVVIHDVPQKSSRGESGLLLLKLSGLEYHILATSDNVYSKHVYSHVVWKPDLSMTARVRRGHGIHDTLGENPQLSVLELVHIAGVSSSLWYGNKPDFERSTRKACRKFRYVAVDPNDLLAAQETYQSYSESGEFELLDTTQASFLPDEDDAEKFDLVVVRTPHHGIGQGKALENAKRFVKNNGSAFLLHVTTNKQGEAEQASYANGTTPCGTQSIFTKIYPNGLVSLSLKMNTDDDDDDGAKERTGATGLDVFNFTQSKVPESIRAGLVEAGWGVE
ncbi:Fumagillin dodecapentaenoate synthase [Apiospora hydei]|uniref:Fumagillin dodecapentaenoate synthase n=1 Tax=Apiospora hydei TaxID=1337664 RepID=A0ABR1V4W2_9PEZI